MSALAGEPSAQRAVLAVDGGNSKTDIALVSADGTVLARGRGPGFTPHSIGPRAAVDTLARAVADLGVPLPPGTHTAACLAGADLAADELTLTSELLRRGVGATVKVVNDTFAVLRAGASRPWGVAVVCGAGVNAAGIAPDGRTARFPSLGRLTGDWGGGEHLGEEVLWHAVRAEDGRGPGTDLAAAAAAHFGRDRATDVAIAIHCGRIPRLELHGLVPVLLATAEYDAVAASIVERLTEEIHALGSVILDRLGLVEAEVVLGGGILAAGHRALTAAIRARYAATHPRATLVVLDVPPIVGAARLGLDHIGADDAAHARTTRLLSP
ncbi:N-acetylglucosamine kinase [Actinokineospora sp. UTMC 2448]|uniref:N-acetylglucosamine kinase n=1 Tax=Actinokineospora sp. UTMC 2448 TaxID=2268449 RepID=UPI0021645013|nr:BadF/BadG/BcrA/BcrD ATPase family protein [Actinokineospora sp. UTMC 2448]UVS79966.1 BadF/BadG/BcrA/BcrD ATPase family protein [Actinokineospora sp. UTMC 2448]